MILLNRAGQYIWLETFDDLYKFIVLIKLLVLVSRISDTLPICSRLRLNSYDFATFADEKNSELQFGHYGTDILEYYPFRTNTYHFRTDHPLWTLFMARSTDTGA